MLRAYAMLMRATLRFFIEARPLSFHAAVTLYAAAAPCQRACVALICFRRSAMLPRYAAMHVDAQRAAYVALPAMMRYACHATLPLWRLMLFRHAVATIDAAI